MFEKGVDDEGCAAILKVDADLVEEFRKKTPASDSAMDESEEEQLLELFARQVSVGSCADILQVDLDNVKEFKAKLEARAKEEEEARAKEEAAKAEEEARQRMLAEVEQRRKLPVVLCGAKDFALHAADSAKTKALAFAATAPELTKDPAFRVSAASAAVGTVAGAVTGGGAGTVLGGVVGAAAGVGPALLTFGMSIPISTGIGSGIGLCVGTATGATIGAIAGGASGYAGVTYRKELQEGGNKLFAKALGAAEMLGIRQVSKAADDSQHSPLESETAAPAA